jgi:hypothetical protein
VIARRDVRQEGILARPLEHGVAPRDHDVVEADRVERDPRREREALHARLARDALGDGVRRGEARLQRRVALERRPREVDGRAIEAERHAAHLAQAAHEESGADQEHGGERRLHHEQRRPQPVARVAGVAPSRLERARHVGARGAQRRHQPGDDAGHDRGEHREADDAQVDGRRRPMHPAEEERAQQHAPCPRDEQADRAADQREQEALDEELADEPPARHAEREPHGDLAPARESAREQQVRDVRTGDEEHEHRRARDAGRDPDVGPHPRRTAFAHDRAEPDPDRRLAEARAPDEPPMLLGRACLHRALVGAGGEAADHPEAHPVEVGAPVVAGTAARHRRVQRDPDVRRVELHAGEPFRGDPDDRGAVAAERDLAAEHVARPVEARLPEPVRDDRHQRPRIVAIVLLDEEAPEGGPRAERPEVARVGEQHLRRRRVGAAPERALFGAGVEPGGGEPRDRLAQRLHERVVDLRAPVVAVASVAHRAVDPAQLVRRRHLFRRPEEQPVEQREDRRVGPDPERQGEHDAHGEPRRAPQPAQRVARVLPDAVEPLPPRAPRTVLPVDARESPPELVHVAERALRLTLGVVTRQAARGELLDLHREVEGQLVVDLALGAGAADDGVHEAAKPGDARHGADGGGRRRSLNC